MLCGAFYCANERETVKEGQLYTKLVQHEKVKIFIFLSSEMFLSSFLIKGRIRSVGFLRIFSVAFRLFSSRWKYEDTCDFEIFILPVPFKRWADAPRVLPQSKVQRQQKLGAIEDDYVIKKKKLKNRKILKEREKKSKREYF